MTKKDRHNSFVMYKNWGSQIKLLNEKQKARFLDAIYNYQCDGILPDTNDGVVQMLFNVMQQVFASNSEKYTEICNRRKEYGKKGGLAKATKSNQKIAKATKT